MCEDSVVRSVVVRSMCIDAYPDVYIYIYYRPQPLSQPVNQNLVRETKTKTKNVTFSHLLYYVCVLSHLLLCPFSLIYTSKNEEIHGYLFKRHD